MAEVVIALTDLEVSHIIGKFEDDKRERGFPFDADERELLHKLSEALREHDDIARALPTPPPSKFEEDEYDPS